MIFFFGASLLLSLIIGVLMTCIFVPSGNRNTAGILFRLFAGGGLGIGVTSCSYFVCLLTGIGRYIAAIDLAICLVLGLIFFMRVRKRDPGKQSGPPPGKAEAGSRLQNAIAFIFAVELVAFVVSFAVSFLKEPHGRWDAWLIWNMHARFLYRGGEAWREAFASGLDWSHWDYPLLLPLSIARGWTYTGTESILVPAAMGLLFTLLILGLLLTALSLLRSRTQGCLAAMILMGTPFFIVMGASQFADIPFAFFVLATFVLLFLPERLPENPVGPMILAGIAAGLSAWTKNEGLLFTLIITVSLTGMAARADGWRKALSRTGWFLAGALPVLMIVVTFKTRLSPTNDIMAGVGVAAIWAKLLDWGRYAEIAGAFFATGISFTQGVIDVRVGMTLNPGAVSILLLVVYIGLTGIRIDEKDRDRVFQTAAVLVMMLAGYFIVYVMTPLDLNWHLMTSLNRLFLQLWPSAVFVVFMAAGIPGQTSPATGKPEAASLKVKQTSLKRKK
jgi:4-amino-4-deoxy-L-arabinose transferase-like glycosyltransferase